MSKASTQVWATQAWTKWRQAAAPLVVVVALTLIIGLKDPRFFTAGNFSNVLSRTVTLALIAIGQTVVIVSGQIDLSVGSVLALTSVCAGLVINAEHGLPAMLPDTMRVPLAVGAAMLVGTLCGFVNGQVTCKAKVPSFVVTLAMMGLARGLALVLSHSQTVGGLSALNDLVLVQFAGLKLTVWVLIAVGLAVWFLLGRTVFGRNAFATGANPIAARLSGVKVDRNVVLTFCLSGLLVGIAGWIEAGRISSASPTMGELMELDAIAAAVIGGASLAGGQGGVGGTLLGVTIMAVLRNGCNLLQIPNEWEKVVIGPLIVFAVLYDRWLRRRQAGAR